MGLSLRRIRIGISVVVFLFFVIIFLGTIEQAAKFSNSVLFLQFVPSLVSFLLAGGGIASLSFVVVILVSAIFGRVYCSGLCPLGILQDLMLYGLRKARFGKNRYFYQKPQQMIRYGILLITIVLSVMGSMIVINLLDPYSLFGRIISHIARPILFFFNNISVFVLESFDLYVIRPQKIILIPDVILGISFLFFFLIAVMVILYGRKYCSLICPVGTFLGILAHFSLFKFQIDKDLCNQCGNCSLNCKAGCIGENNKGVYIDHDRCVACFNCLGVCKKEAVTYQTGLGMKNESSFNLTKRQLIVGTASAGVGFMTLGLPFRSYGHKVFKEPKSVPLIPPGALSLDHFNQACTACYLCIHACRTHVLKPAFMQFGLKGILQPVMDFNSGKCAYECNECGKVCPTDAITPLELESKKRTKIGSVKLLKELCITHQKHRDCGACIEVCPSHAVYAVLKKNVRYPEIKPGPCIGCGACQLVCPVKPEKAIIVEGLTVHSLAEKPFYDDNPQIKKVRVIPGDEFPF